MKRDLFHLRDCLTVLVEEDASIRRSWIEFFEKCGLKLLIFESAESFISDFRPDGCPVEFFFDQDFGSVRGVGTKLASYVQTWPGRTGTSLVTAYVPETFENELAIGLIDAVLSKFPEEIFGADYFKEHVRQKVSREGVGRVIAESVEKISEAFGQLERVVVLPALSGRTREVGA